MDEKYIILPNRDEMLARLLKVNRDPDLQRKFYPILLEEAGNELVAEGVVMKLTLAIYEYTKDMPQMVGVLMQALAPDFIDAVISDEDAETAQEAKDFLAKILSETK